MDLETAVNIRTNRKTEYFSKKHTSLRCAVTPISHPEREITISKPTLIPQRTFGVELSILLERENLTSEIEIPVKVPRLIYYLTNTLRKKGLQESGLFRLCGKHSELISKQTAIDGGLAITEEFCDELDVHTAADLFKSFLRSLPTPIIPVPNFFTHFLVATNIQDEALFISYLGSLVKLLPERNFVLLDFLCNFFNEFTKYYQFNKMGAQNLAIIFAPSIFGQSDISDSFALVVETKATSRITKSFIEKYEEIFKNPIHLPISRMVAYESHSEENWSIIKGEVVLVLRLPSDEDFCQIQVDGRLYQVSRMFVESKCKVQPNWSDFNEEKLLNILEIRERALKKLLPAQDNAALRAKCVPLPQKKANLPVVEEKTEKKARRRSVSKKLTPIKKELPVPVIEITPAVTAAEPAKEEDDKKKRHKKHRDKKSQIYNWYGAATTRSTPSFFVNGIGPRRKTTKKDSAPLDTASIPTGSPVTPPKGDKKTQIEAIVSDWYGGGSAGKEFSLKPNKK